MPGGLFEPDTADTNPGHDSPVFSMEHEVDDTANEASGAGTAKTPNHAHHEGDTCEHAQHAEDEEMGVPPSLRWVLPQLMARQQSHVAPVGTAKERAGSVPDPRSVEGAAARVDVA